MRTPDRDQLVEQLRRLGVDDPQGHADSELGENVPHVARARVLRQVRRLADRYRDHMPVLWRNLQRDRERHPEGTDAKLADVLDRCLAAGVPLEDLALFARFVAQETAFGFAYLLEDLHDDELGAGKDLPAVALAEIGADGAPTGRWVSGLHEDLVVD